MADCITERQDRNYDKIPSDTDVLITHSPAYAILDFDDGINYGDERLLAKVMEMKPRVHLFGHIHAQHGTVSKHGIVFSNGAIMDSNYSDLMNPNLIEV